MTNEELLAEWDAGRPITTVSMGGLGEGYELAIHRIAMEMLRYMMENPIDWDIMEGQDGRVVWKEYSNQMDASDSVSRLINEILPSGAQWGAATNIATVYARQGYEKGIAMAPKDRIIEVTRA